MRTAAQLYDLDPRDLLKRDIPFYVSEIPQGAQVLDIGVGTGRIAFALAKAGAFVTGIDKDPAMLAQAVYNLWKEDRAVQARMSLRLCAIEEFENQTRFDAAIFGFRTFAALTEWKRQLAVLERCARLLCENGRLFISLPLERSMPSPEWVGGVTCDWVLETAGGWKIVRRTERKRLNQATQVMQLELVYHVCSPRGELSLIREQLELAHISDMGFRALAERSSLAIECVYGDYDRRELGAGSEMIYVLKPR